MPTLPSLHMSHVVFFLTKLRWNYASDSVQGRFHLTKVLQNYAEDLTFLIGLYLFTGLIFTYDQWS